MRDFGDKHAAPLLRRARITPKTDFFQGLEQLAPVVEEEEARRTGLKTQDVLAKYFQNIRVREGMHPIVPIIIGDTAKAIAMSAQLLDRGVYVSGFGYPVVPQGQARLRCQISAAHTREHLDRAIGAIVEVAEQFGVLAA